MLNVLIVDDHPSFRRGVKEILNEELSPIKFGEASDAQEMLELVRRKKWDLIVMDISMPGLTGPEALKAVKEIHPALPVLVLSMHPEDQYAVNLLRAGANGYLRKECSPEMLVAAIRTVASGRRYISPALGDQLAGELDGEGHKAPHTELSDREFQVFCKLAAGQAVSEVADELFLSVKTVSTYRARILDKMRIKSNAHITYYAIKHGLIQ